MNSEMDTARKKAKSSGLTEPRVIGLREACRYIGVAAPTMYKYLKDGLVPAFKLPNSRVWKFDREKLDSWILAQQRRETKA